MIAVVEVVVVEIFGAEAWLEPEQTLEVGQEGVVGIRFAGGVGEPVGKRIAELVFVHRLTRIVQRISVGDVARGFGE